MSKSHTPADPPDMPECFVIMPIAEVDTHPPGHFLRVYTDIISPACAAAGFKAIRADDVKQSNLIHLDILEKLLACPMAVCDLSTSNPNVLFELGLRQAFDKPVALIQEVGTRRIFDIALLRYTEYRKERLYHEVNEDQRRIASCIRDTAEAVRKSEGINSLVKLLALSKPASLPETTVEDQKQDLQRAMFDELARMRSDMNGLMRNLSTGGSILRPGEQSLEENAERQLYMIDSELREFLAEGTSDCTSIRIEFDKAQRFGKLLRQSATTPEEITYSRGFDARLKSFLGAYEHCLASKRHPNGGKKSEPETRFKFS